MRSEQVIATPPQAKPRGQEGTAERYLAFAFAAADMLVETDLDGMIGFAAGAFRVRFEKDGSAFLGQRISSLFSNTDHDALDLALVLASHAGRIAPMALHLADTARSAVSVGALLMQADGRQRLSFAIGALPVAPIGASAGGPTGMADREGFARAVERALRDGSASGLSLVEVTGWDRVRKSLSSHDRKALETALDEAITGSAPISSAGTLAEGRYGVVAPQGADLSAMVARLEAALQTHPATSQTRVEQSGMALDTGDVPTPQAARALRYALGRFAEGGQEAAKAAGASGGLMGIIASAEQHTLAMRAALRERRFRLVYQPVVRLHERDIHHYEALLRPIPTPNVPMRNTQEFVTFAEAVGLSEELDWAVLETAIEALNASASARVAVNMSGLSMQNAAYRKRLLDRLAQLRSQDGKLAASRLLIELTETAEIADLHAAASSMEQLRSVGVPVCLDDFGAGAAVFRYLRAFGVDFVKLDGEYVRAACRNKRDRALVASMIEIAHNAGAAVVAEMIETEAEAALMKELGATFGQGWLFGRPGRLPGGK
jgi:EAL domain-containing protein (putative c-di-GMP-specific phosphodiesterase class I)